MPMQQLDHRPVDTLAMSASNLIESSSDSVPNRRFIKAFFMYNNILGLQVSG